MPKYIITYGLKDQNMISEEIHVPFFHEAFDIAQNKALEALDDSGLIIDLKTELFKQMDVFNARIAYMEEAQNHIDFNVREVIENDSTMYLVSKQAQLFDNNTFKILSLKDALNFLSKEPELSLDTETTGLDCFKDKLLLVQLGTFDFQIQFDIQSEDGVIPKELKDFMNNYPGTFILQNAKFDLQFLFRQDVLLKKVYDTMLVETIITNGLQFGGRDLKTLGEKYCGVELDKSVRGEILFKGLTNRVLEYGANDIKYLSKIKEEQLKRVKEFNLEVAVSLDNSFVVVLAYTEYCGIKLDYDKWKRKTDKEVETLNNYKEELEKFLYNDGKTQFFNGMVDMFTGTQECIINWNSPKQVVALLEDYGVNCTIYEKQVKKKTANADILSKQKKDFPILEPYLQYKKTQKEIGTYGYNWKDYINLTTGRIHTSYQQLMNTGRLSSKNPNLQNLPSNEATRECFVAEPGNVLVDADYSSQEQIILANFSKEENLLNFYARGFTDMHSYIAFLMYPEIRRSTLEELTPEKLKYLKKEYPKQRSIAKSAGFAIIPFII